MTWTKTPDDYPDQLLELSDAAYRLHHAATTYSNRIGLDGLIAKARLSLVPVPARTRRPAVIRELVASGFWADAGDAWELADYFLDQLSAEEVAARRAYDAVRQRIRFASSNEQRQVLKVEEAECKTTLNDARERRRARASQRESPRESQRPVPTRIRPVPSRSNQERGRGRETPASAPWNGAQPALDEDDPEPRFVSTTLNDRHVCFRCLEPFEEGATTMFMAFDDVSHELHEDCGNLPEAAVRDLNRKHVHAVLS